MIALEQALRKLAAKLTGRELADIPNGEMERVIEFMADNAASSGEGVAGPQGDPGPAGASMTAITLMVDGDGKLTGGTVTLSDNSTIPVTVE